MNKNFSSILAEFNSADKRYPIRNLELVLTRIFTNCEVVSDVINRYDCTIASIKVKDILEWRYQTKGNSYVLSVKFIDGLFWIQNENESSTYPELDEHILFDLVFYTESIKYRKQYAFSYESDSGKIYGIDPDKVTCDCPNFRYRTSHFPVDDERRFCKHLSYVYRCYPELLPKAIADRDENELIHKAGDKTRYPRELFDIYISDIDSVMDQFKDIIKRYQICGSYRRLAKMVSDLDLLIELYPNKSWESLLDYIENIKGWQLIKNIGKGDAKAAYMIDGFIHLDMKCIDEVNWPFALMHFTGSKDTNIKMRRIANSQGYKLNEYGLFSLNDDTPVTGLTTEKDVYDFLGVPYIEPWQR